MKKWRNVEGKLLQFQFATRYSGLCDECGCQYVFNLITYATAFYRHKFADTATAVVFGNFKGKH